MKVPDQDESRAAGLKFLVLIAQMISKNDVCMHMYVLITMRACKRGECGMVVNVN